MYCLSNLEGMPACLLNHPSILFFYPSANTHGASPVGLSGSVLASDNTAETKSKPLPSQSTHSVNSRRSKPCVPRTSTALEAPFLNQKILLLESRGLGILLFHKPA